MVHVWGRRKEFNIFRDRHRAGQVDVGSQADSRVPSVGNPLDVVLVGCPGDVPGLGETSAFGAIGLDDVNRPLVEKRQKTLPPREHFSGCDGNG